MAGLRTRRSEIRNYPKRRSQPLSRQSSEASAARELREMAAELERRVEQRTAELARAHRELDSFTYVVSHDLRAPLRTIRGYSALLAEDYAGELDERGVSMIRSVDKAARHMAELIEALLNLSAITRSEADIESCNVSQIVEQLRAEFSAQEPDRKVEWEITPDLWARADRRMLEAALRSLVGNAWKYSSRRADARIALTGERSAGSTTFCVRDNGAGFDMQHAGRLFQPFRRMHADAQFPGLGVGLATVHRIVERHGGTITADAEPDKGATFCVTLPDHAG